MRANVGARAASGTQLCIPRPHGASPPERGASHAPCAISPLRCTGAACHVRGSWPSAEVPLLLSAYEGLQDCVRDRAVWWATHRRRRVAKWRLNDHEQRKRVLAVPKSSWSSLCRLPPPLPALHGHSVLTREMRPALPHYSDALFTTLLGHLL